MFCRDLFNDETLFVRLGRVWWGAVATSESRVKSRADALDTTHCHGTDSDTTRIHCQGHAYSIQFNRLGVACCEWCMLSCCDSHVSEC